MCSHALILERIIDAIKNALEIAKRYGLFDNIDVLEKMNELYIREII